MALPDIPFVMIKFMRLLTRLVNTKSPDIDAEVSTDVEQELQRLALRKVFQQQQFSVLDGLNEYDGDFSSFTVRGELITHDMLRTAKRVMQAHDQKAVANNQAVTQDPDRDATKSA